MLHDNDINLIDGVEQDPSVSKIFALGLLWISYCKEAMHLVSTSPRLVPNLF